MMHRLRSMAEAPQILQCVPTEGIRQLSQYLFAIWVYKESSLQAFRMSRVAPPFDPIGKSTCTGGFILRSAAFSGLPTLTVLLEHNLGITRIPHDLLTNSISLFVSTMAGPP